MTQEQIEAAIWDAVTRLERLDSTQEQRFAAADGLRALIAAQGTQDAIQPPNQSAEVSPVEREVMDALNWSIAYLYLQGEIGRAELIRKAAALLSRPAPLVRPQEYKQCGCECPAGSLERADIDKLSLDSHRLWWLTEDHADANTRKRRDEILSRMPVMSYSAVCDAINNAIAETEDGIKHPVSTQGEQA